MPTAPTPRVGWIRLAYSFPPVARGVTDPDAGWPDPGEPVRWEAHVFNVGDATAPAVSYAWSVAGGIVREGTVDLPPGASVLELEHPWSAESVEVGLQIREGGSSDGRWAADALIVPSRGLPLTLWVSDALVAFMERDRQLPIFPLWARGEVEAWNGILAGYRSESEPRRIVDRIRLDRVEVLPAGAPRPADPTVTLEWSLGVPGDDPRFIGPGSPLAAFADQTIVLHELLHQRGITDLYAYRVRDGVPGGSVDIVDADGRAAGSPRMPVLASLAGGSLLYQSPYMDHLMGADYARPVRISRHTAWGLDLLAGRRPPRWIDEHGNLLNAFASGDREGSAYLALVPDSLRLRLVGVDGAPHGGAVVDVFFDHAGVTYENRHGPDPDLTVASGPDGRATLSLQRLRDLAAQVDLLDSDVIIVRVTKGPVWGYAFLPVLELNLAYLDGSRGTAEIPLRVTLR